MSDCLWVGHISRGKSSLPTNHSGMTAAVHDCCSSFFKAHADWARPCGAAWPCRWPFGRGIRRKFLPTTLAELEEQRRRKKDPAQHDISAPYQTATFDTNRANTGFTNMVTGGRDRQKAGAPRSGEEIV